MTSCWNQSRVNCIWAPSTSSSKSLPASSRVRRPMRSSCIHQPFKKGYSQSPPDFAQPAQPHSPVLRQARPTRCLSFAPRPDLQRYSHRKKGICSGDDTPLQSRVTKSWPEKGNRILCTGKNIIFVPEKKSNTVTCLPATKTCLNMCLLLTERRGFNWWLQLERQACLRKSTASFETHELVMVISIRFHCYSGFMNTRLFVGIIFGNN